MQRSEERIEFLFSLLVSAVEGGTGYWAEVRNYKWDGIPESEASVELHELEDETDTWHKINLDTIARGINALADGKVTYGAAPMPRIATRTWAALNASNDVDGEADATTADMVVQAAIFGDIRYG